VFDSRTQLKIIAFEKTFKQMRAGNPQLNVSEVMIYADMIQKLLEKKKTIDTTDEAQRLTFVCEQLYGSDWDAHYAA
jgi:hypothetical protein